MFTRRQTTSQSSHKKSHKIKKKKNKQPIRTSNIQPNDHTVHPAAIYYTRSHTYTRQALSSSSRTRILPRLATGQRDDMANDRDDGFRKCRTVACLWHRHVATPHDHLAHYPIRSLSVAVRGTIALSRLLWYDDVGGADLNVSRFGELVVCGFF